MDKLQPLSYDKIEGEVHAGAPCASQGYQVNTDSNASCTNAGFVPDEVIIKPPTAPPPDYTPQERPPIQNLGELSATEVRDACMQYASENCCYGKKFVKEAAFTDIHNGCIYHYRLESFGEKRETAHRYVPFKGQLIDGPENGPPPDPWSISVPISQMFVDKKMLVEVPHTAYVKPCFMCVGNCRVRCDSCSGRGGSFCFSCSGRGRRSDNRVCFSCSGTGRTVCIWCTGTGQVKCKTCNGRGNLKHFQQLIVTWKNHMNDFFTDSGSVPVEMLLEVTGRDLFNEMQRKVYPINHCPDPAVNNASSSFIMKHETSFPNELIRMQRQTLTAIPLTKAKYLWKGKEGECFVFGFQNKVYFERYPQPCCCCTCF